MQYNLEIYFSYICSSNRRQLLKNNKYMSKHKPEREMSYAREIKCLALVRNCSKCIKTMLYLYLTVLNLPVL